MSQGYGKAFGLGGLGCLGGVILLAVIGSAIGGTVTVDNPPCLVLFLFALGGAAGLLVNFIYRRGRRDAARNPTVDDYFDP